MAIVGAAMLSIYILVVMEIFSLSIGGLILALIWKRTSFNIVKTSLLGGIIAVLPMLTLLLLLPDTNYDAWVDGKPTVIDGVKTSYGRWQDFQTLGLVFVFGWIGGASFWWFGRPKREEPNGIPNDQ